MGSNIQRVVIVGGGTAGWLSACYLAARRPELSITLVEAPDIPTIGVGEGTWPTMRETLATIGLSEPEFLRECDASFKQGSRFDLWATGADDDSYLHPFTPPPSGRMQDLLAAWDPAVPFAAAMTAQTAACAADLAPRQRAMPDYAGTLNYAYHLDAGKFAALLARHGTQRLGVVHVADQVIGVIAAEDGDIAALELRENPPLAGDLFLDCSGHAGLLIGGHYGVPRIDRSGEVFNDRALALQVPVPPDSPIASQTIATAHRAGWIWDIALPHRRGIGCVYASRFLDDDAATEILAEYVRAKLPQTDPAALAPRPLSFSTGHRSSFWHRNCLAIGLSAGFIEPLEASAIVLIELSLRALAENFPGDRAVMDIHARRFDALFHYRWDRVVDFLKLHYVLSEREEPYWRAHRDPTTISASLADQLALWRDQPPSSWDLPQVEEIFSAASQQFVLYGMGFARPVETRPAPAWALDCLDAVGKRARALAAALPTNRSYQTVLAAQSATHATRSSTGTA